MANSIFILLDSSYSGTRSGAFLSWTVIPNPTSFIPISTSFFSVVYPRLKPSSSPRISLFVFSSPSIDMRIPIWGNSLHSSTILSVKNPLVEITILSLFLYSSRTISFRSVRMNGSPPVILVKYIGGSFLIVSTEISSSALDGALYLLHIEQRALHLYVTITVPFSFFAMFFSS